MTAEYGGGFLAIIARRHSVAAFGPNKATAPIVDGRLVAPDAFPKRVDEPVTAAGLEALAEVERATRCLAAAERMAERYRRR